MFRPELQTFLYSRVPNTRPVVQIGGAGPFIGYKYYPLQRGNGFLDLLKGAAKFLAPIAFSAGGTMLTELGKQREAGSGWKQSLVEGAKSAAGSGLMTLGKQMEKRKAEQEGKEPPAPGTPRWAAGGPFWKRIPPEEREQQQQECSGRKKRKRGKKRKSASTVGRPSKRSRGKKRTGKKKGKTPASVQTGGRRKRSQKLGSTLANRLYKAIPRPHAYMPKRFPLTANF